VREDNGRTLSGRRARRLTARPPVEGRCGCEDPSRCAVGVRGRGRSARTLSPPVTVTVDLTVDLTAAEHVEVVGVDLLRWAVDHDESMGGAGPVKILLPDELPDHPPAPARMIHHLRVPGWSPA
jgi:hypothetical protein